MEIKFKNTNVLITEIKEMSVMQLCIVLGRVPLVQVTRLKYLGSWITEDAGCEVDIRARVGMAKAAFWENKEPMRRNIRFKTKLKLLNCYVFTVLNYECESWTWNKAR